MIWNSAYAAGSLPIQGSEIAAQWDGVYNFLIWMSLFFFVLVIGAMVYFAVVFRRRPGIRSKYITGSHVLETLWTLIPTVLLLVIFGWGYSVYNKMTQAPSDAMEIRVLAKQWSWAFQYEDGRTTNSQVFVPINTPVKLLMSSEDVLHSMFIPNFRIKQDVVPGMYTAVWFEATVPGRHQIYCTEYCGTGHSVMLAEAVVLTEEQWDLWKRGKDVGPIAKAGGGEVAEAETTTLKQPEMPKNSLAAQGEKLMQTKGCVACHTTDGKPSIGPTYKGIWGETVELADGSKVKVDENYIRESVLNPTAKVVKGFNPVMPPYQGQLNEAELNAIIAYIKSLK